MVGGNYAHTRARETHSHSKHIRFIYCLKWPAWPLLKGQAARKSLFVASKPSRLSFPYLIKLFSNAHIFLYSIHHFYLL